MPLAPPEPLTVPRLGATDPWGAEVPERKWTAIVLHHTATDQGSVESIHAAHLAKEWLGIGYHFVVGNGQGMEDGAIEPTFRWRQQLHGAHAGLEEYNEHGIGIALVGNFDEQPPTSAQIMAVTRLVHDLRQRYSLSNDRVIGHSDVKPTACPGRLFPLAELRRNTQLVGSDRNR